MNVKCPKCGAKHELVGVRKSTDTVTVVCDKCTTHFEVKPGKLLGWRWPSSEERKR